MATKIGELIRQHAELLKSDDGRDDLARKIARYIATRLGDPETHGSIPMKVARALIEGSLSRAAIDELLDTVERQHRAGEIRRTPGALFTYVVRYKLFPAAGIPWNREE